MDARVANNGSVVANGFAPRRSGSLTGILGSNGVPTPTRVMRRSVMNPSLNRRSVGTNMFSFIITLVLLVVCVYTVCKFVPNVVTGNTLFLGFFFALNVLSSFRTTLAVSNVTNVILSLNVTMSTGMLVCRHAGRRLHDNGNMGGTLTSNCSGTFSTVFSSGLASVVANVVLFGFNANPVHNFTAALVVNVLYSFFATMFVAHVICRRFVGGSGLLGLAFASTVSGGLLMGARFSFVGGGGHCFVVANIVVLMYVTSFMAHNLDRDVSFANKHGFGMRFRRRMRPRRMHRLVTDGFNSTGMDMVSVNASGGAIHVDAGCHVRRRNGGMSSRVRTCLCRALGPLLARGVSLTAFVSHSGRANNDVIDSRGMNPDVTSSVGASTV